MPLAASACYVLLPACFLDLEFSNPNRLHLISFRLLRSREDYAMADILTGGRVIFGVGRGYHTREVETFGAPLIDQNANREMFEEGVEVLFKAFEGKPFSHQAKYYTIPPEVPYRGYTLKEITLCRRRSGSRSNAGSRSRAAPSAPSISWRNTASAE